MAGTSLAPRVSTDWAPIREAFVTRSPIPTYTELSVEFALSVSAVSRMANEELWPDIRAKRLDQRLREAGASELILKAIQGEGQLVQKARDLATKFCSAAEILLEELTGEGEKETKISTRISTLNNLGFALANVSRFIESVGLVGMPQDLRNSKRAGANGNDAGQPWEKQMLQQINVTVNAIKGEGERLQAEAKAVTSPAGSTGPADGF